jgi:hypothetical protein
VLSGSPSCSMHVIACKAISALTHSCVRKRTTQLPRQYVGSYGLFTPVVLAPTPGVLMLCLSQYSVVPPVLCCCCCRVWPTGEEHQAHRQHHHG